MSSRVCLAMDFSGATASVALIEDAFVNPRALTQIFSTGRNHLEQALGLIQEALGRAKLSFSEVSELAVPCGPGSFTGLRVGLATAKGFARKLDVPLHTVSGAEMRALDLMRSNPLVKKIEVLTSASSERATLSLFTKDGTQLKPVGESIVDLSALQPIGNETIRLADANHTLAGTVKRPLTAESIGLGLRDAKSVRTYQTEAERALVDAEYHGTRF